MAAENIKDGPLPGDQQNHVDRAEHSGINSISTSRISLPGHTAPFAPSSSLQQPQSRRQLEKIPTLKSSSDVGQHGDAEDIQCLLSDQSLSVCNGDLRAISPPGGQRQHQILQHEDGNLRHSFGHRPSPISSHSISHPRDRRQIGLEHAPPMIQGVQLVSLHSVPDRFRSVFPFPLFNAIQSKCFPTAYQSHDNFVVSAPTGGGKTAILEMAICRLVSSFPIDQYKIVYMAPIKSLCSERQRDWQEKFAMLDLACAELTGDTENANLRNVQNANIIVTTPEKWDSMTRKWKDHIKLMQMVKLFLIDEVHILKDARGATLEAVVSRMKSIGSDVRFIALSATVPNFEDIATWLGKDASNPHVPAPRERFGESFRPVKLQKHVVGLPYRGNDFGFDGACDLRLVKEKYQ